MSKPKDYSKYFIPTKDGVLVDTEIFEHRETLRGKIWNLLKTFSGAGNNRDLRGLKYRIDDSYLARKEYKAIRNELYKEVAKRDGEYCRVCKTKKDLTVDHIVPLSRGGENDMSNMQILCRRHNSQKGAK